MPDKCNASIHHSSAPSSNLPSSSVLSRVSQSHYTFRKIRSLITYRIRQIRAVSKRWAIGSSFSGRSFLQNRYSCSGSRILSLRWLICMPMAQSTLNPPTEGSKHPPPPPRLLLQILIFIIVFFSGCWRERRGGEMEMRIRIVWIEWMNV